MKFTRIGVLVLFICSVAISVPALQMRKALPALSIATAGVEGIVNPADVCNGWHGDVCPVAFDDLVFQDKIAWVTEEVGAEGVKYSALPVSCGPGVVACLNWTPTYITFRKGPTASFYSGAREFIQGVESVRVGALQAFGTPAPQVVWKVYPGYEARHPSQGNPVGEPWTDHPYAKPPHNWKMFRPSATDSATTWPPGATFQLDQRKWRKWRAQIEPGNFFGGGRFADAWEEVTLK